MMKGPVVHKDKARKGDLEGLKGLKDRNVYLLSHSSLAI